MLKIIKATIFLIALQSIIHNAHADPWFTGPIIATSGITTPKGHTNIEPYAFYTSNSGVYNRTGKLNPSITSRTDQYQFIYFYGLADNVDMQFSLPYSFNSNLGKRGNGLADTSVLLGFQAFRQKGLRPNLRIILQELLPNGKYDLLNPSFAGTDSNGKGSYQTTLGLAFQYLSHIKEEHYLSSRLILNYTLIF